MGRRAPGVQRAAGLPRTASGRCNGPVEQPDAARLIDRRAELLAIASADRSDDQRDELARLSAELEARLDRPPPTVRRLVPDAPEDPGALARSLATKELVHPVRDEADLRDRLDLDRRCFLLEHPALPDRPLNVVWCALSTGVPTRIDEVLDPGAPTLDPATADTAVFYSIWNAEPGLQGLPGGRRLLEGAVDRLSDELPGLATFVTLSPVPALRSWCEANGDRGEPSGQDAERAATELLTSLDDRGRPVDPVARFHLGNGARLLAVRVDADRSERGRRQSFGVMANYRYAPEDRAANRARLAAGQVPVADGLVT